MARAADFKNFYAGTGRDTLRVTYALCGDRQVALDATVEAYRRAWRDWSKLDADPLGWVRTEAWKSVGLMRGTHPLRRRHEDDSDTALLDALHDLGPDERRLIVLLTIADIDLEHACREIDLSLDEGMSLVPPALERLERELGVSIDQFEPRLRKLGEITSKLELPPVDDLRESAVRGRTVNAAVLALIAIVASMAAAVATVDTSAITARADVPQRQQLGNERPDAVLLAQQITDQNLLTAGEVSELEPSERWKVTDTETTTAKKRPYATCQTRRFANRDPLRVFLRTFEATGEGTPLFAQSVEVSRNGRGARDAYQAVLSWYANCDVPQIRLLNSWVAKRAFGDFRVLRLRSKASENRLITVGFAQSGRVTTTLVHESTPDTAPDVQTFTKVLNTSVKNLCRNSGGPCASVSDVVPTPPPAYASAPGMLGVIDLPPVPGIDDDWVATEPTRTSKGSNPASTLCDTNAFDRRGVPAAMSRVFVIPEAEGLPREFGLAETVTRFKDNKAADAFVERLRRTVSVCVADSPSAKQLERTKIDDGGLKGYQWRLRFTLDDKSTVVYRMAIVRRESAIAQLSFVPFKTADLRREEFADLAQRAGERLNNLPDPKATPTPAP